MDEKGHGISSKKKLVAWICLGHPFGDPGIPKKLPGSRNFCRRILSDETSCHMTKKQKNRTWRNGYMYISFLYFIRAINNITMQRSHAPYELYFYKVSCNCQISGSTLPRPSCDLTLFDPNGADAPRLDDLTTFLRGLWQLPFFSALLHTAVQLCGVRKGILCWESTRLLTWWIVTEKHLGSQLFKMLKPKLSISPSLIPKNKPKNILPKNKQNDMQSVEVSLKTILKIMCQKNIIPCVITLGAGAKTSWHLGISSPRFLRAIITEESTFITLTTVVFVQWVPQGPSLPVPGRSLTLGCYLLNIASEGQ